MTKTNREKAKKTSKEKYGDEFYNNRLKCAEKLRNRTEDQKEEWRKKVREKWKTKSKEDLKKISDNRKNTLKEKYGDENYCINVAKESIKIKYNVENPSQIPGVKEKVKKTWSNKSREEINIRNEKVKKTLIKKYGYSHIMYNPEEKEKIIQKGRQTKIKLGKWLSDEQISLFKLYYRKVFYFTSRSVKRKFTKEELSKIGMCGIKEALQIDHIFSIKEGFLNNVLPYVIGHENNLRIIPWLENDIKKHKSDINLQKLFLLISKE